MLAIALALAACLAVPGAAILTAASAFADLEGRPASDYDQPVLYTDRASQLLTGRAPAIDMFDTQMSVHLDPIAIPSSGQKLSVLDDNRRIRFRWEAMSLRSAMNSDGAASGTISVELPPIAVRWPADKRRIKAVGVNDKVLGEGAAPDVLRHGQRVMYIDHASQLFGTVVRTPVTAHQVRVRPVPLLLDPILIPEMFLRAASGTPGRGKKVVVRWKDSEYDNLPELVVDHCDEVCLVQLAPFYVDWPSSSLEVVFPTGQLVAINQGLYTGKCGRVVGEELTYRGVPKIPLRLEPAKVEAAEGEPEAEAEAEAEVEVCKSFLVPLAAGGSQCGP